MSLKNLSDKELIELYELKKNKRLNNEINKSVFYDTKFAYHIVRLLLEVEMILVEHDLDLERHREQLKSIKRGEWTQDEIIEWASSKEKQLEKLYHESKLQYSADFQKIKILLLQCLEHHYGSLKNAIIIPNQEKFILKQIKELIDGYV